MTGERQGQYDYLFCEPDRGARNHRGLGDVSHVYSGS